MVFQSRISIGSIGRGAALSACRAMPGAMQSVARRVVAARKPGRKAVARSLIMAVSVSIRRVDAGMPPDLLPKGWRRQPLIAWIRRSAVSFWPHVHPLLDEGI